MKKLTTVLAACALMGTLVACGNKEETASNSTSTDANAPVTLNVWAMGEEAKSLGTVASEFEKQNPNIHVVVQSIPWGMVHQKLLTAIAGDSTPDVSMMGTSFMAEMVQVGAFEELSPYLAKDNATKLTDFIPSTLLTNQFDGKTYGFPWTADTRIMFYRKDLMNQAGFKEFPKTWNEMYKLAEAEKKNGVKAPIALPKAELNASPEMLSALWQNNTDIIDAQGKSLVLTPEFKQSVNYYTSY
ncbi:MAG: extracellular solute-binding protein, partial [Amoebophilaceae bacterium]|nr:extracellular solute-binding protein [Amoebophilaceae bacterium]